MGTLVLKSASLIVGGVDLTDHIQQVEMNFSKDVLDGTYMGCNSKAKVIGLGDSKIPVTFLQDYAASKTDATLWGIFNGGSAVVISGKPTSAAASSTNPWYSVSAVLAEYSGISGKVGDLATVSVTFEGTGDVTRATAS